MYLQSGTFLQGGEYKIIRFIKSGGFGCTYEAYQKSLDRHVAIKEFFWSEHCRRDPQSGFVTVATENNRIYFEKLLNKFIDEAKVLSHIIHPNIVRVSAVFEENGTAYYVMDYIDGISISEKIHRQGYIVESEALGYIRTVAQTLHYIHNRNRLHLDIKPSNIMINDEGNIILIDFGVSKQYNEEGLNSTSLLGYTIGYAPIEQMGGDVRTFLPSTDIYSLAATLYHMLTGCCPPPATELIKGLPTHTLQAQNISHNTIRAIKEAMQADKEDRPQSIAEFLDILDGKIINDVTHVSTLNKTTTNQDATNVPITEITSISSSTAPNNHKERKNKNLTWVWLLLLAFILGMGAFISSKKTEPQNSDTSTTAKLEFKHNDKTYLVEQQEIEQFAKEYPEATIILEKDGQKYKVKSCHYQEFISGTQHVDTTFVAETDKATPNEGSATNSEQTTPTIQKIANGYINGHEWVDLGLPSGTKWATYNIGANTPEEYGNYYAWGETAPKTTYTIENSTTYGKDLGDISGNPQYDAARAIWGGIWRMPTKAECEELTLYCTRTNETINGIKGSKLTSKRNGNSIFIPHAWLCDDVCRNEIRDEAILWSSTPSNNSDFVTDNLYSCCLNSYNPSLIVDEGNSRHIGYPIRPVCMGHSPRTTSLPNTSIQATYKIGDYYDNNGVQGVVFEVSKDGHHGKILSMNQSSCAWCTRLQHDKRIKTNAASDINGYDNTNKVLSRSDCNEYEAFVWCRNKGNNWYLPSKKEFHAMCRHEKTINSTLAKHGGDKFSGWYWLSTEYDASSAWLGQLWDDFIGTDSYTTKNSSACVRAISTF